VNRPKKEQDMLAYVIAEVEVTDPTLFEQYRQGVPATVAAHGGRYLVRGGAVTPAEGDWRPKRLIILEFPSVERAKAWHASPAYAPLKAMRERSARSKVVIVEGLG
jgi:uncharacterized protein (DUF1330 family)